MARGTARLALAVLATVVVVSLGVVLLGGGDDDPGATAGEALPVVAVNAALADLPRGDRAPAELASALPQIGERALAPPSSEGVPPTVEVVEEDDRTTVLEIVDMPLDDAVATIRYRLELTRTTDGRYRARSLRRELTCRRGEDAQGRCV